MPLLAQRINQPTMNLNNSTSQKANFEINTANGRQINVEVGAHSIENPDLTRFQEPFNINVIVGSESAGSMEGLDGSEDIVLKQGFSLSVA